MLCLHVDDLKYESKYKELRKKVKIVEEVRVRFYLHRLGIFCTDRRRETKCRTMTSYLLRFSKHSTTFSGCDLNERKLSPRTRL